MTARLSAPGLLLLYVVAVSVVITLAPFRFSRPPRLTLAWIAVPVDVAPNVLLFLPLGFLYRLARPRLGLVAVGSAAAVVSAALEAAQIYLPGLPKPQGPARGRANRVSRGRLLRGCYGNGYDAAHDTSPQRFTGGVPGRFPETHGGNRVYTLAPW